jgi:formate-nitrite transporter family protein
LDNADGGPSSGRRDGAREGTRRPACPSNLQAERIKAVHEQVISDQEIQDIEECLSLRTPVIYPIVRKLGDEEISRPRISPLGPGMAAAISSSCSVLAQWVLSTGLLAAHWTCSVTSLGYSLGFLGVELSRQPPFTENAVTVMLPVIAEFNLRTLGWLWSLMGAANLLGALVGSAVRADLLCPSDEGD